MRELDPLPFDRSLLLDLVITGGPNEEWRSLSIDDNTTSSALEWAMPEPLIAVRCARPCAVDVRADLRR